MAEALRFFRAFEVWIYLLLGVLGLFYVRKFILAWQELRSAVFSLERENAQARLNQAASVLAFLLVLAVAEFVLVSFVAPTVPGVIVVPTATVSLFSTPTSTLLAAAPGGATPPAAVEVTPSVPALATVGGSACLPGQIEITSPQPGQEVSGVVEVIGSANIANFGFYKFEMRRPGEAIWATIQAGNQVKKNEKLGDWDTRRLSPGEYQLALVVVDNQARASLPCIIPVRVIRAPENTPSP